MNRSKQHPDPEHKRIVHVWRNDKWEPDGLENVKRGNLFRLFESDGTPVPMIPNTKNYEGLAVNDSFVNAKGRNEVQTVPIIEMLKANNTIQEVLEMYPVKSA